jgi:formylmethanofuran dehydrogenase subunit D
MPDGKLTLITGRSTRQGTGVSTGKDLAGYRESTNAIEMSPADMARLGLHDGDMVRLRTRYGEATVKCRPEEISEGLGFMAFGPATGHLIGAETHASGMPDTKGFEVELERL